MIVPLLIVCAAVFSLASTWVVPSLLGRADGGQLWLYGPGMVTLITSSAAQDQLASFVVRGRRVVAARGAHAVAAITLGAAAIALVTHGFVLVWVCVVAAAVALSVGLATIGLPLALVPGFMLLAGPILLGGDHFAEVVFEKGDSAWFVMSSVITALLSIAAYSWWGPHASRSLE